MVLLKSTQAVRTLARLAGVRARGITRANPDAGFIPSCRLLCIFRSHQLLRTVFLPALSPARLLCTVHAPRRRPPCPSHAACCLCPYHPHCCLRSGPPAFSQSSPENLPWRTPVKGASYALDPTSLCTIHAGLKKF